MTYSYACKPCETQSGEANIVTTKGHESILHKSMASNELVAHIINMKYQHAMPLYRQETYFNMLGVNLSMQTFSNWIMSVATEFEQSKITSSNKK